MKTGLVIALSARNDGLVNRFNPVQLSAWRANVDMQYCVSRHKVIEYCAKYATKCEPLWLQWFWVVKTTVLLTIMSV